MKSSILNIMLHRKKDLYQMLDPHGSATNYRIYTEMPLRRELVDLYRQVREKAYGDLQGN
jgi:hypothetical protein